MPFHVNENFKRLENAEAEVQLLTKQIQELKGQVTFQPEDLETDDPEIAKIVNENNKLKYRLKIIKKAVDRTLAENKTQQQPCR